MADDHVLEPRGKAPAHLTKEMFFKVGVSIDAEKVAISVGDLYAQIEPHEADQLAQGLLNAARAVRSMMGVARIGG